MSVRVDAHAARGTMHIYDVCVFQHPQAVLQRVGYATRCRDAPDACGSTSLFRRLRAYTILNQTTQATPRFEANKYFFKIAAMQTAYGGRVLRRSLGFGDVRILHVFSCNFLESERNEANGMPF